MFGRGGELRDKDAEKAGAGVTWKGEFTRGVQSYSVSRGQAPPFGHPATRMVSMKSHRQIDSVQ
jgi:hypothetical protein